MNPQVGKEAPRAEEAGNNGDEKDEMKKNSQQTTKVVSVAANEAISHEKEEKPSKGEAEEVEHDDVEETSLKSGVLIPVSKDKSVTIEKITEKIQRKLDAKLATL